MENGYSVEFSNVIVHTSDRSHRANAALGTTAFTIGNHICFSPGAYDPGCRAGRLLLAHELAHVVQSRLGAAVNPPASMARRLAAEMEADAAALSVLYGRRPVCSLALPVGELSAWGPAGHYYTVYYALLAAGLDNAKAARLAFYTQMPDEVVDLDAEEAGYGYFDVSTDVRGDTREDMQDNNRRNIPELLREKERCWLIQMGLHCLTGRDSWAETEARRQVLARTPIDDDFAFGLALHPLGDSFAHRKLDNERLMYSSWLGHAVERPKKRHHMPDEIHMRPALYRDYVRVLFHLACAKWPDAKRRAIWEVGESPHGTKGVVSAAIETISTKTSEAAQIETIRELSRKTLGQDMIGYDPENDRKNPKLWWETFSRKHGLAPHLLSRALLLAGAWRHLSKTVRVPVASGSGFQ